MSGSRLAAPFGTRIDRGRPLRFTFGKRSIEGYAGDTVASALLASGTMVVGRSFKLQRPRGIFSCGVEEPCALADLGTGAARIANARLTDVPARDGLAVADESAAPRGVGALVARLGRYMPAGFYYKTFMWPHWALFEPAVRELAARAEAPDAPDPERYDEVSANVEVLVVGAGMAGLQAALSAARAGREVMLLEQDARPGGWMAAQVLRPGLDAQQRVASLAAAVRAAGVRVLPRTCAVGVYDHRFVAAIESRNGEGAVRERLWKIRAQQLVLATGAFERPMLFPDNDRPGVMLAGAVERYAALYGVACGRRVVLAAACDSAYRVAESLQSAGLHVTAIVDRRAPADIGAAAPAGVRVLPASAVVAVQGERAVRGVQVAGPQGAAPVIDADLVACSGGLVPDLALYSQAGGSLAWREDAAMFVPERLLPGVAVVGACAGALDLETALAHADAVGRMQPGDTMPRAPVAGAGRVPADTRPPGTVPGKIFVDLHNDVTSDDVALAARESYRSVEHLKRYTTTGMGTEQGKTSNVNALVLLGAATGRAPQDVGTTRFRPPYQPVTINALAAGRTGSRLRPLKPLAAREFHARRGALFEEFGGWERPAAYPRENEPLLAAAAREAAQVRAGVGLFDGSPLGKIELVGPDAAAFLDLMYVGTMSTLPVGGARYGVLLNENGTVVDDGIVARLGADHFWVNTTSGGVDRAVLAFEEWLQCEYVHHRVFVMPATAQWGNVTVSGPLAWELLARAGFDAALAPSVTKHMTIRDGEFAGGPARVLRASFTGEMGYEINVPMARTGALLETLWRAGQALEVGLYGVEALMILRTEKGFIHVGADTDGTTLPQDIGMARAVERKAANFVGRRSLARPAGRDAQRLQLVGLQPVDKRTPVTVGAHLSLAPPPTRAEGFVTSSCFSPSLGHPIALAMLRGGSARAGEKLRAWHLGRPVEVEVVKTPFFDPQGERVHA